MIKLPNVKNITPLWVIALFVVLTEAIAAAIAPRYEIVIWFVLLFPLIVFSTFVYILLSKPWVLYSPSEYPEASKPEEFIKTLMGKSASSNPKAFADDSIEQIIVQKEDAHQAKPEDQLIEDDAQKDWFHYYFVEKDYRKARELLLLEIEKQDDEEEIIFYNSQAILVLSKYDFPKAITEANHLLKKYSKNWVVYLGASRIYSSANLYDDAIDILISGMSKVNQNDGAKLKLSIANIYTELSETEKAIKLLKDILQESSENEIISRVYRELGKIQKGLDKNEDARKNFLRAYKNNPNEISNLEEIVEYFNDESEFGIELVLRKRIINIKPGDSRNITLLGNCYLSLGLNSLALKAYQEAKKLTNGKEAWIINNIGNLYNNVGFYHEAESIFQEGLKTNPSDQYGLERMASAKKNIENEQKKESEIYDAAIIKLRLPESHELAFHSKANLGQE